jgi:HD superfamily phosphohydrolase
LNKKNSAPDHGLSALSARAQQLVIKLTGHWAVQRLGQIRQLGFAVMPQQTRLEHTLSSIDLVAAVMANATGVSETLQQHVLAAVSLADVGRAPFSNSLDPLFAGLPGMDETGIAIDVRRSLLTIKFLEETEQLLSKENLSVDIVCGLLEGLVPLKKGGWLRPLLDGPLDIDRLTYVPGDLECAKQVVNYNIRDVVKGILLKESGNNTLIDAAATDHVVDFVFKRAQLYQEVYYGVEKLALEHVVREFFRKLWKFVETKKGEWNDVRKPKSASEFLRWTDETVIDAFEGARWEHAPIELQTLRNLIRNGDLQAAELRQRNVQNVDLTVIDDLLSNVSVSIAQQQHWWLLSTSELPELQMHNPKSIIIQGKRQYRFIEDSSKDIRSLADPRRRCPIMIFPTTDFKAAQAIIEEAGLTLSQITRLRTIKRSASR